MLHYLRASPMEIGLVMNFGPVGQVSAGRDGRMREKEDMPGQESCNSVKAWEDIEMGI